MATITTNAYNNLKSLSLDVWEVDIDIVNNRRKYGWKLYGSGSGTGYHISDNFKAVVGGVQVYYSATKINMYVGTIVAQGDVWINHNTDGSKWIDMYCEAGIYTTAVNCTASGGFWATPIPRYANITANLSSKTLTSVNVGYTVDSAIDWIQYRINGGAWINTSGNPIVISGLSANTNYDIQLNCRRTDSQLWSQSNIVNVSTLDVARVTNTLVDFNVEDGIIVNFSNPSGKPVNLRLETLNPTLSRLTRSNITSPYNLVLTQVEKDALYAYSSSSNTFTARIVLDTVDIATYNSWKDGIATITNANPTFSNFDFADVNPTTLAITGNNQKFIKGYSNAKLSVTTANKAVAIKSATMSKYRFESGLLNDEKNYNASATVETTLNAVQTTAFAVKAIDSRLNQTTVSKNGTLIDYANVIISNLKATRLNLVDTQTILQFDGVFTNWTGLAQSNNIQNAKYRYRETGGTWSGYTNLTLTTNTAGNYSYNAQINGDLGSSGFNSSKTYEIEIVITDRLSSATLTTALNSSKPLMWKDRLNRWLGIGKKPTCALTVAGDGEFDGNIYYTPTLISNTDVDNIIKSGIYRGANLTHSPNDGYTDWWYIHHIQHTIDYIVQIAYPLSGTKLLDTPYIRTRRNSTWGTWRGQRLNDSISLTISANPYSMAFPAAWTQYIVPFDITYGITAGSRLIRNGSAISIGKGIKTVEVTCTFAWYNINNTIDTAVSIYKNGVFYAPVSYDNSNDLYCTRMGNPIKVSVQEGDWITMLVSRGGVGNINIFGGITSMTVEAIE